MKATGEVMSIGTSFEQGIMKAVRGIELGLDTLTLPEFTELSDKEVEDSLSIVDDRRIFMVYEALKRGISVDKIHEITMIDEWFLYKMLNLTELEATLQKGELTDELYLQAKNWGYLDATIERLSGKKVQNPRFAAYKMVDTCAAEFEAKTPYFYSTYDEENEAKEFIEKQNSGKKKVIVFGSGPIRIGQGIEFDYCCVHCVWALKKAGYEAIIANRCV